MELRDIKPKYIYIPEWNEFNKRKCDINEKKESYRKRQQRKKERKKERGLRW